MDQISVNGHKYEVFAILCKSITITIISNSRSTEWIQIWALCDLQLRITITLTLVIALNDYKYELFAVSPMKCH